MFNKIIDLLKNSKAGNFTSTYQNPLKATIKEDENKLYDGKRPVNPTSGECNVIVVGVSSYQEALKKICDGRAEKGIEGFVKAEIIAYDDNPHDAYAVRIEIGGETVGHLSRKAARIWRSKMISEGFSHAVTCPAKIGWDRSAFAAGSYGVWLNLDLTLSDSISEKGTQTGLAASDRSNHIEFLVNELNRFELLNCKVGDEVNLWQKGDSKEIFIYRHNSPFGEGKIGVCPDEFFETISKAPGCDATILSIYEGGCKIACRLISKAEMAERLKPFKEAERKRRRDLKRDLVTPVDYSDIDTDIYKCFISNNCGMCDAIGTWEQLKTIEERIARLCRENNGKYYKTRAKSAKFAIIFAPNARVYSNVTSLREQGYKVTTFEKALQYFGLTDLWDCKNMAQHEYDLKKFLYEDTFHKPFPSGKGEYSNQEEDCDD